jgi:uncharacterized membrane protein YfbV (UPF0208 family)
MIADIIIIVLIIGGVYWLGKRQRLITTNQRQIHEDLTNQIKKLKASIDDVNGRYGE